MFLENVQHYIGYDRRYWLAGVEQISPGKVPLSQMLIVTTLFMILVTGRFTPIMALITVSVASQLRSSFMSFISSAQQISAALASIIAGSMIGLSANGEMTNFGAVGIVALISTALCTLLAIRFSADEN